MAGAKASTVFVSRRNAAIAEEAIRAAAEAASAAAVRCGRIA